MFNYLNPISSGSFQSILSRQIENPEVINLLDTPGVLSLKSIPFNGINNSITLDSIIITEDIGTSGTSAANLSFDCWIKPNISGNTHNTFFDVSIMRSSCATSSGFDGIYSAHILSAGTSSVIEFRIDHDLTYVLSGTSSIVTTAWNHVFCLYASGAKTMNIFLNGAAYASGTIGTTSVLTASQLGERNIAFGGVIDEMRLWLATGSVSSINRLASLTSIGKAPEDLAINDFTTSSNVLAGWWRLDSVSAFQLFSAISGSITDSTPNHLDGTPSGFQGSDIISSEQTIIMGLSASGDLLSLQGGSLDHGGFLAIDPSDDTIRFEMGSENLIQNSQNVWTPSGSPNPIIVQDNNNIFYGASGIRINAVSADTGVLQNISNSALLFTGNDYVCSLRYRSISGSTSGRIIFTLGSSAVTLTAVTDTGTWQPVVVKNTLVGSVLTGSVGFQVIQTRGLIQIDGIQISEGDDFKAFIAPSRLRKPGQTIYQLVN